ncbi:Aldehyde-alcohol dehydrogenase [Streptomyces cyanogenus]|uniref:Aldehyde-alcohol dehydrogenase n=1 Tax=Streptomyces cyanogenus TaxID=80860 RepID=A0ABX7U083_STRCY|nr:Aldehyde-alcohol dehydrogenase [Streptomyces cyanogenus]
MTGLLPADGCAEPAWFAGLVGFVDRVSRVLQRRDEPVTLQIIDNVQPEPSIDSVQRGARLMRDFRPDTIIALGGGSPMDAAKVMWLLYEHPDVDFADMRQKFSDIRKRAFRFPPLGARARLVCIPTTSGTGGEVTPFAVISDPATGKKYSLADYALTPSVAGPAGAPLPAVQPHGCRDVRSRRGGACTGVRPAGARRTGSGRPRVHAR